MRCPPVDPQRCCRWPVTLDVAVVVVDVAVTVVAVTVVAVTVVAVAVVAVAGWYLLAG